MTTAAPVGLTDSQEIAMSVTELERVTQTPEQIYAAGGITVRKVGELIGRPASTASISPETCPKRPPTRSTMRWQRTRLCSSVGSSISTTRRSTNSPEPSAPRPPRTRR